MKDEKDRLIQLKLSDYLDDILGDSDYCKIKQARAEYIEVVAQGLLLCHVQWTDEYGQRLPRPTLWRYKAWANESERWKARAEIARIQRIEKFIFDKNMDTVVFHIMDQYPYDKEWATSMAFPLVKNKQINKLRALIGLDKLIEKESEL